MTTAEAVPAGAEPPPPPASPSRSPYPGLRPFTEDDHAFFFGREREVEIVAANLLSARLTLLYGASGVGKSSVLRAGVIHTLREQSRANFADEDEFNDFAVVLVNGWSDADAKTAIAAALREEIASLLGRDDLPDPPDGATLADVLGHWNEQLKGRLVVVFDQFEEYFRYHRHELEGGTFDDEFAQAVNRTDLRANFLLSIRDDELAELDLFRGKIPSLFDNRLKIDHLTCADAEWAIRRPLEVLPADQRVGIETELVQALLASCSVEDPALAAGGASPGTQGSSAPPAQTGGVKAPLLQLVLERLWRAAADAGERTLTLARLESLDGVDGILDSHLHAALDSLSPAEQDIAAKCFDLLVSPTKTKIAYPASALTRMAGKDDEEEVTAVLDKLCAAENGHILNAVDTGLDGGSTSYELSNADLLADSIVAWQKEHAAEQRRQAEEKRRRRVRNWAIVLIALVVIFAALAAAAAWQWHQAKVATASAASVALASAADQQLAGHRDLALLLSLEAYRTKATPQAESSVLSALTAVRHSGTTILRGNQGGVTAVAFGGAGNTLAVAGSDGTVQLWDDVTHTRGDLLDGGNHGAVTAVALSADRHTLAAGYDDGTMLLWDLRNGTARALKPSSKGAVTTLAFDGSNGDLISAADSDGWVSVWATRTGKHLGTRVQADDMVLSPKGSILRTIRNNADTATVLEWEYNASRKWHRDTRPAMSLPGVVAAHAYYAAGPTFAAAYNNGKIQLMHLGAREKGKRLKASQKQGINSVAFSEDGKTLATAGGDGLVHLFDVHDLELRPRGTLNGHQGAVSSLAFTRNGKGLAAGYHDGTVLLWPLSAKSGSGAAGKLARALAAYNAYSFSADRKTLALVVDGSVQLWNMSTKTLVRTLRGRQGGVLDVGFSPDGQTIATAGYDGRVLLWNVTTGKPLPKPKIKDESLYLVLFSPKGQTIATVDFDGTFRLWNWHTGKKVVGPINGHQGYVSSVAFSPSGRTLATVNSNGTVLLWDVTSEKPVSKALYVSKNGVGAVAFSPTDETMVATGDTDGTVLLFDTKKGSRILIGGNQLDVRDVAFSPDGKTVASAGADGSVALFDLANHVRQRLNGNQGAVQALAFNPDGSGLTTLGDTGTATWTAGEMQMPADPQEAVCRLVSGNLTAAQWKALVPPGRHYHATCPDS